MIGMRTLYSWLLLVYLWIGPLFFEGNGTCVHAQSVAYPVTVAVQSLPPFTNALDGWTDPVNNQLGVSLLLNDRRRPDYQVRLRVTIAGMGVRLVTRPDFQPRPIPLDFGAVVQLTSADLTEYFELNNLSLSGISRQQYLQNGGLPEGTYSVCIEAVDYARYTEEAVSQSACTYLRAALLDPPVINEPLNLQTLVANSLLVQWDPRHAALGTTRYEVQVFEVDPSQPGFSPEDIYSRTQPYWAGEITGATSFHFDPSFTPLGAGKYMLIVRAVDLSGRPVYKNGGRSRPVFFEYGGARLAAACPAPTGLVADVQGPGEAEIRFEHNGGADWYTLTFREKRTGAHWYTDDDLFPFSATIAHTLRDLKENTTYEVQVTGTCGGQAGTATPVYEFTTGASDFDPATVDCGTAVDSLPLMTNRADLRLLAEGDVVKIGHFDLRIAAVRANGRGGWDGSGQVKVDWLAGRSLQVDFTDLYVNTDRRVYEGTAVAVDEGLGSIPGLRTLEDLEAEAAAATPGSFCGASILRADTLGAAFGKAAVDTTGSTTRQHATNSGAYGPGASKLPVVLGDAPNLLAISDVRFTPRAAFLGAYASFRVPMNDQFVAFAADDVAFHPGGLQGEAKLHLLAGVSYALSKDMKLTFRPGNDTYVRFDCFGINQISVAADLELCDELAVPVDPLTYAAAEGQPVTASLVLTGEDWGEFTSTATVTPFELRKLPGWAFTIENAVLDMSGKATPEVVTFPDGYVHPDVATRQTRGAESPAWKGFYLGLARVRLPSAYFGDDSTRNVSVGVEAMILDETGFSAGIYATELVTLDAGRVETWPLSVDSLDIRLVSNAFRSAHMRGKLLLPAFRDTLGYAATFEPDGTSVYAVTYLEDLQFDAMAAQVTLARNTEIGITYDAVTRRHTAYAKLYGGARFGPNLGGQRGGAGDKLAIPTIRFENLHLVSQAPYLEDIGTWALASETDEQAASAGFPLTLHQVGMFKHPSRDEIAFGLDLSVNLVKTGDQGFGARGSAFIICDVIVDPVSRRQRWEFQRVRFDRLALDYAGAGFKFNGFIEAFEQNAIYGAGFRGRIEAEFLPKIEVGVAAMFGKKDDFRYFFADAMAGFPTGISLGPSGLSLYGFGGGISYHMARVPAAETSLPATATSQEGGNSERATPQGAGSQHALAERYYNGGASGGDEDSPIGTSLSGTRYVPDRDVSIGIKATVAFGAAARETFNGDITFEMIFNSGGGIRTLALLGNLRVMTPPGPGQEPQLATYMDMQYDFSHRALDAYLRLQVNAAQGLIRGAYANNVAGEGKIHADANDWYFYLGEPDPDKRLKLGLDISRLANIGGSNTPPMPQQTSQPLDSTASKQPLGSLGAGIGLVLNGYLDAGSVLPPFPDPPQKILNLFQDTGLQLMSADRSNPDLAAGGGFLLGAGFDLTMPNLKFLIFYAEFSATMGFDVMLKNYGSGARCLGREDAGPPGFNGWYATGQMYSHIYGAVGIEIDIAGYQGRFEAFNVEAGAALKATLPAPFYFKGAVAGRYSILNGMISGSCAFEFEAGTECNLYPGGNEGIRLVESLLPGLDQEDVSVFARPRATFNLPVDRLVPLRNDAGELYELRPEITYFRLIDATTGLQVPGSFELSKDGLVAAFTPEDVLPGQRTFRGEIEVTLLSRPAGSGPFRLERMQDGTEPRQSLSTSFTTGAAPTTLADQNIVYSYPAKRQLNLHRNQHNGGYIQLQQGQGYLFLGQPGNALEADQWTQEVQWWQDNHLVARSALGYDASRKRVHFALPGDQLLDGSVSDLRLVNVPRQAADDITDGVQQVDVDLAESLVNDALRASGNTTQIIQRTNRASTVIEERKAQQLYQIDFRTSVYATFADKVAALPAWLVAPYSAPMALTERDPAQTGQVYLSIDEFGSVYEPAEAFGVYDLRGKRIDQYAVAPFVRVRADTDRTADAWYRDHIGPNVYERFREPTAITPRLRWRNDQPLGTVPVNGVYLRHNSQLAIPDLTEETGALETSVTPPQVALRYQFPYYAYRDYADYFNQVSQYAVHHDLPAGLREFMEWNFRYPRPGSYGIEWQYVLPGEQASEDGWIAPSRVDYLRNGINNK